MSPFNDSASLLPCLYKCFALLTSCILLLAPISSSASKTNPLSSSDSDRIPQRRPELLECCGHIFRSCLQLIGMLEGWCQHKCLLTKWWQPRTQSHGKLSLSDFLHSCHQQVKPTLPEPHLSLSFLIVFCASIDRSLVCVHAAAWTPPPSLPLSGHKVSDHPSFLFPLWKGFIWWHHLLTKKRERGPPSDREMDVAGDALLFQWNALACGRRAEAKRNNLFTCSVWLSKPWQCRASEGDWLVFLETPAALFKHNQRWGKNREKKNNSFCLPL